MSDKKGLRFAPLIRVSTEKQEKRGESLNTQQTDLIADIESMGGEIYKRYEGQEHATPDYERRILDELISDATQNKFDAIIIWSIDRWSRDNERSATDLRILKDKNIRFFVRTQEYDLHDENAYFMINLYSLMGRTQAYTQTRKSMINRIARARQGVPVAGRIPFGRTYDKKTGTWGIDNAKKLIIEDAANRYIAGEDLTSIADSHGISMVNLNKVLNRRCGGTWDQSFKSKQLKINETVTIKIPRLLDDDVIKKIRERSNSNRTFTHGIYKNQYLLSSLVFDDATKYTLTGATCRGGNRYYRTFRGRVKPSYQINAHVMETAFLEGFTELLLDTDKWKGAAFDGDTENHAKKLQTELEMVKINIAAKMKKKESIENKLINCDVSVFVILQEKFRETMIKLNEDLENLSEKRDNLIKQLKVLPTLIEVEDKRKMWSIELKKRTQESYERSGLGFEALPFDEKKKIINKVFGGQDENGQKYGIYVKPLDGTPKKYQFKAYGRIFDIHGLVKAHGEGHDSFAMPRKTSYTLSRSWIFD